MSPGTSIAVFATCLLLAACASYQPGNPQQLKNRPGTMLDGPGLFTGKQGEFVIWGPQRSDEADDDGAAAGKLPPAKPPSGYKPLE